MAEFLDVVSTCAQVTVASALAGPFIVRGVRRWQDWRALRKHGARAIIPVDYYEN